MNQKLIEAQDLYELILQVANKFLRNAKRFELHILQDHKPTYAEMADIMDDVAHIIFELADDYDPMLAQKANDYVYIMRSMGIAIREDDKVRLSKLVEELEAKPGL